jgi:GTP-binding protein SAR1
MSTIITYIQSFIKNILVSFGLIHKKGTILFIGLDNAGKTTFLHKLKTNSLYNAFPPTNRAHLETFSFGKIKFAGWDLGGHESVRNLWEDYVCEASAVMFLVDATEWGRLDEVRDELDALVGDKVLGDVPLAIMLNKCDLVDAQGSEDIANAIGYQDIVQQYRLGNGIGIGIDNGNGSINGSNAEEEVGEGEVERIKMFRMSVYRGEGYQDAFRWIASFL